MTIFETLEKIENTTSRLEIERLLKLHKENSSDDFMEKCLDIAMNPYRQFYINKIPNIDLNKSKQVSFFTPEKTYQTKMINFFNIVGCLEKRVITGNGAKEAVKYYFENNCENETEVKYLSMILRKGLDIGLGWATIEKIYPGLLKGFSIQLCTTYNPAKHSLANRIEQDKFNGYRCIAKFNSELNEWEFISRSGKKFNKSNFIYIEKELNPANPVEFRSWVFDGELDCGEFELTSSVATTEKPHPQAKKMVFRIFDIIPLSDWNNNYSDIILKDRLEILHKLIDNEKYNYIYAVETIREYTEEPNKDDAILNAKNCILKGNDIEGSVLKDIYSTYNFTRDDSWIRIKPFLTNEFKIIGINEGKKKGTCGSINVEGYDEQTEIFVNSSVSGIKNEIKLDIWNNPEKYIGKMAEIRYQYVTKKGSLRHSDFIRLRDKENE
jgi:DNA ligase-1